MENKKITSIPFIIGIIPLWLMFFFGFLVWWALMSELFSQGAFLISIIISYSLPIVYTLVAWFVSKKEGSYIKLLHFVSFIVLSILYSLMLIVLNKPVEIDFPVWLGIAFIASVIALMQYPKAGLETYSVYKPPLFIGGVIFMPLFIYIGALLPNIPKTAVLDKAILLPIGMLGFWLSAAWFVSKKSQGAYAPNLEIQPLMPFRPDFLLPGGVLYIKGVVLMGMGLMILIHPQLGMPNWNWWGFILAFWGIITLIPLRGIYKMVKGRRLRMLGKGGFGFKEEIYKDLILFIGLNILLYGFVSAFFGTIPFLTLAIIPEFNAFTLTNPLTGLIGVSSFILSFIILIPVRGYYKIQLLEGIETSRQIFIKQVLLYLGTVLLIVAFVHILNLPPIRGSGILWIYPLSNPIGFSIGTILFLAGSVLILGFRPIALKNEFEATIETMMGTIADAKDEIRIWVMKNRIETLVNMPEKQRDVHVKLMMQGLNRLSPERKKILTRTQMEILTSSGSEKRRTMMQSMDKAMFGDL